MVLLQCSIRPTTFRFQPRH